MLSPLAGKSKAAASNRQIHKSVRWVTLRSACLCLFVPNVTTDTVYTKLCDSKCLICEGTIKPSTITNPFTWWLPVERSWDLVGWHSSTLGSLHAHFRAVPSATVKITVLKVLGAGGGHLVLLRLLQWKRRLERSVIEWFIAIDHCVCFPYWW